MKYFIGYLIQGEVADWHNNLAREIAEKFNIWKVYEKLPPHITIFNTSYLENVEPVVNFLENWSRSRKIPGNFTMNDYDYFESRAVFAETEPDSPVRTVVEELIKDVKLIPDMTQEDFPFWHPHATLAYKITPEEINAVWEYVQTLKKPNFILPFDNVTLFRFDDTKWIVEKTFRLLN